MTTDEVLQKFLKSYQAYYNIETEDCLKPFAAVANFSVHNEQYMLVKAAKYADVVSNEYVYFYTADTLEEENVKELTDIAWEDGVNKVTPDSTHRNSDVTVYLICEKISDDAKKLVRKTRHYKSYAFGFKGWSNFRLVAIETSSNKVTYNYQGRLQKKLVGNILTY